MKLRYEFNNSKVKFINKYSESDWIEIYNFSNNEPKLNKYLKIIIIR